MVHDHGSSRRIKRHSMGHLQEAKLVIYSEGKWKRRTSPPCTGISRCPRERNPRGAIDERRLARTLRANDGNSGKVEVEVEPLCLSVRWAVSDSSQTEGVTCPKSWRVFIRCNCLLANGVEVPPTIASRSTSVVVVEASSGYVIIDDDGEDVAASGVLESLRVMTGGGPD